MFAFKTEYLRSASSVCVLLCVGSFSSLKSRRLNLSHAWLSGIWLIVDAVLVGRVLLVHNIALLFLLCIVLLVQCCCTVVAEAVCLCPLFFHNCCFFWFCFNSLHISGIKNLFVFLFLSKPIHRLLCVCSSGYSRAFSLIGHLCFCLYSTYLMFRLYLT
eukprot:m.17111 g.17111  ORF g.17111 m.17111 type:complete len:159 (+) comp8218_c0_seq1:726-1202(+)